MTLLMSSGVWTTKTEENEFKEFSDTNEKEKG